MISQFGTSCPGFSDYKGARSDMYRQTLFSVFHSHDRLEIPVMQRRFCWGDEQLDRWVVDSMRVALMSAKKNGRSGDSVGGDSESDSDSDSDDEDKSNEPDLETIKNQLDSASSQGAIVYAANPKHYPFAARNAKLARFRVRDDNSSLLIVDGQQRLVVTTMLIASIRDAILNHRDWEMNQELCKEHLDAIHSALFSTPIDLLSLPQIVASLKEGDILKEARLIPSYPDRLVFYNLLCRDGIPLAKNASRDHASFRTFAARSQFAAFTANLTIPQLCNLAHSSLCGVSVMSNYLIAPNLNLCQVFQWFQELGIKGSGLLGNKSPGVGFHTLDFVRNFFMSVCMDYELEIQNRLYHLLWYQPIERIVGLDWERFDSLLDRYMTSFESTTRIKDPKEDPLVPEDVATAAEFMNDPNVEMYTRFLVYFYQHCLNPTGLPKITESSDIYDDDDDDEVVVIEDDDYLRDLQSPGNGTSRPAFVLSNPEIFKLLNQFENDAKDPSAVDPDALLEASKLSLLGFIRHFVWYAQITKW
ncbi:hypothetical protein BCR33DRAFT_720940 [Rhizoclosmatium globosum]|uniref:DUF262 domain-containing protein n=1 Tax=Rhizoclosmatium globosum TaxID=329046 RepID=A0A1Y2BU92_9FUNG|nr:hypothetical protein BCR33DRAFT_720940 [Rhizoclosmatium globosum]|eukprot:ORY38244.1 hypothetical protein BCR33DRAFT_720940 [Rhizoclosmatium globosum]